MSLPVGRQDLTGNHVTNDDLGLSLTDTSTSNAITTPVACTNVLLVHLSAGSISSLLVSVHDGSPDFDSPDLSGSYNSSSSNTHAYVFNTTSLKPQFSVRITDGGSMAIDELACLTLGEMTVGEGWHDATSALNAVESEVTGDGSGTFSIAVGS